MIRKFDNFWLVVTVAVLLFTAVFSIQYFSTHIGKPILYEEESEEGYDKPGEYFEYISQISKRLGQEKSGYKINYAYSELQKAKRRNREKLSERAFNWTHRGPGNVGGRTREVILDPNDATRNTWFAASASGGVWKTTDAGSHWECLTDDLPNLATNAMTMAPSNHDVIYIGTGEGYGGVGMVNGSGMFKSVDRGLTWEQLESTIEGDHFRLVNKIIVDQEDEDILIVGTNSGIYKSIDGGDSWNEVYSTGYAVQDLEITPSDPEIIYAAVKGYGVLKSIDNGDSWEAVNNGFGSGGRIELSVSPVDANYIFASVEGSDYETHVYISVDAADSWRRLNDMDQTFVHFLGAQGWFNNVVEAHPFNKNKVFIAGVTIGSLEFQSSTSTGDPEVRRVDTIGTAPFLSFINFGGTYLGGGMSTGVEEGADVEDNDYTSVEIRFGPGVTQKAYRFTVPEGEGPGVPPEDYTYHNYIDVPFQVWDTDNDRQLMVSIRDQERDCEFNLVERDPNDDLIGREYIFVQSVEYSETPDANIAQDGGHYHKMIYFYWPTLAEDGVWEPENLPESMVKVDFGSFILQDASTTVLTSSGDKNPHVDHHDLDMIITNEETEEFMILDANDGGLSRSYNGGETWAQLHYTLLTTQFYGVSMKPGYKEFVGGMQDNGTYQSPMGSSAGYNSHYISRLGGDGFETLWHTESPTRILASIYYNGMRISLNGGVSWQYAVDGITAGDGPFVTRLSNSPDNPDLIFAVGNDGVYYHSNFCSNRNPWEQTAIGTGWNVGTEVTSFHNVEVSLADPSVVWAGAGMYDDPQLNLFLSTDYGETFEAVNIYTERELGYLSAIATHPSDAGTAYALFSVDHAPKILRTTDYGDSWEDISGFGEDSTSSNGFPDVMVYSLLVFPYNTDIIWAGTEIGIFESVDNGETWYYADNGMPAVSIWQMFIQDNTIVAATYGRGIWTASMWPVSIEEDNLPTDLRLNIYPNPVKNNLNITLESEDYGSLIIDIYDLSGKKVFNTSKLKNEKIFNDRINVSEIRSGQYLLTATIDDKVYNKKVVID
ncbi:MAG: T9SS type A sorting domain-containing protein [Bacteroidales bacterium]|nr:T9SS type A sorting domain-containing protein [Bacteroidales bacterium]